MSNRPILFALAPMGTALSSATGECPWRPSLRYFGPFCADKFRLGGVGGIHLSLEFSVLEETDGIANAKGDIFGVPDLLARASIIVSLHPGTWILEMHFILREPYIPSHTGRYIPWAVSKYGWYLGEDSLNTDATWLDMSVEGISFPPIAAPTFLGTRMVVIKEGIVWMHPNLMGGQQLILEIANDRWIRIPLVSLCTKVAPDLSGYHRCSITIRSVHKSTAHVFIGETLFRHVTRVKFDHYEEIEIEEVVVVPLAAPIQSTSLRHLPIFHPPVPHTDIWGDSTLRLYPARYAMPARSKLKGVVIPKGHYDFHYIGPATEYESEYEMAGSDSTEGPWVRVYTLGGFFLEKKIRTYFPGGSSLVFKLLGGHALQRSIQPALWTMTWATKDGECVICKENFIDRKAVIDGCKHCFHSKCIREWANRQANCPLCRGRMKRPFSTAAGLVSFTKMIFRSQDVQLGFLCYVIATMMKQQQASLDALLTGGLLGVMLVIQIQKLADWIFQRVCRFRGHSSIALQNLPLEMVNQIERWIPT